LAPSLVVIFIFLAFLSTGGAITARLSLSEYSPAEYVPDEIIVKFKEDVVGDLIENHHIIKDVLDLAHGRIKTYLNHEIGLVDWEPTRFTDRSFIGDPYLFLIRIPENNSVANAIELLQANPCVEFAERNSIAHASFLPQNFPNDFSNYDLWGLSKILAPEAWYQFTGSSTVVVAVLDSGIDLSHGDLAANVWTNPNEILDTLDNDQNGCADDIHGWDFVNGDNDPTDDFHHGTHVSGILGAVGNNQIGITGICWNVKIMPIKIINQNGVWTTDRAINGIDYATNNGAFLINNSYGVKNQTSQALESAIRRAQSKNKLFIVAAGKDETGRDSGYDEDDPDNQHHWYPADYTEDNIITVLSTGQDDARSNFSCYGPISVDIGAPGFSIWSTWLGGQYQHMSGTSQAAPHVSGAAALALGLCPGLTSGTLKSLILDGSDKVLSSGECVSGGRLNVYNVVNAIGGAPQPSAPANLSAYSTAWNIIQLNWQDNSNNEVGFEIQRKDQYQTAFLHVNCTDSNATSVVTFQDCTIDPSEGRTYTYRVRAANKAGISSFTNTASASVPYNAPAAPTDLECLSAVYPNVNLIWSDMANNELCFYLERRISGTGQWSVRATLLHDTYAFTDSQVQRGKTYDYRMRAYNPLGYSSYSNIVTVEIVDW
jgi:subtilisin family serine protease